VSQIISKATRYLEESMAKKEASKKKGNKQEPEHENNEAVEQDNAEDSGLDSEEQGAEPSPELQMLIDAAVAAALAEQQDSVLRAHAEVQNMRRRAEADIESNG
jgi:molecular chaperone GrpE